MNEKKYKKGATLAEIMIAISIFALFAVAFSIDNTSMANTRDTMRSESVELLGYFSGARSAAMTNEVIETTETGGTTSLVSSVPFGVYVENNGKAIGTPPKENHVVFFADMNASGFFDPPDADGVQEEGEDFVLMAKDFFQERRMQNVEMEIFLSSNGIFWQPLPDNDPEVDITSFSVVFASPGGEAQIKDNKGNSYRDMKINLNFGSCTENFYETDSDNVLCERISFNTIQRFFERKQLFP